MVCGNTTAIRAGFRLLLIGDDQLVATIDFDNNTISSLSGQAGTISGIDQGYLQGDLTFYADQWSGNPNNGEFQVAGTFFVAAQGTGESINIGAINGGIGVHDLAAGLGYLMYSAESVHTRFASAPPHSSNSDHFVAVRFFNGQWQYNNNDSWIDFAPLANDRLLAEIDFDNDTISSLEGSSGTFSGIDFGYESGDLVFYADQWNGVFNNGEFDVTGSYFTI